MSGSTPGRPAAQAGAILVTGATGNVGREVCRRLEDVGVTVFAAVRSPKRIADTADSAAGIHGAAPRRFDFTDPSSWEEALDGVSRVFLVRPPHLSNVQRDLAPFLEFLASREVRQIVFLSVQGAENNTIVPHHKIEDAIDSLTIPRTFLRPSFFMQNLTTTHLSEIRDEGRIFVPAGNGTTNFIDVRDIAEAAAVVLLEDGHEGSAYTLTGRDNYTYYEVADHLSRLLETEIVYEPAHLIPFIRYQLKSGRSIGHALVMYALYSVTRLGRAGGATDDFESLVGRPARSLDEFIVDHRHILRGS